MATCQLLLYYCCSLSKSSWLTKMQLQINLRPTVVNNQCFQLKADNIAKTVHFCGNECVIIYNVAQRDRPIEWSRLSHQSGTVDYECWEHLHGDCEVLQMITVLHNNYLCHAIFSFCHFFTKTIRNISSNVFLVICYIPVNCFFAK